MQLSATPAILVKVIEIEIRTSGKPLHSPGGRGVNRNSGAPDDTRFRDLGSILMTYGVCGLTLICRYQRPLAV